KSLKEFTTFKIGGKASNFFEAKTFDDMKKIYVFAKENNLKTFILGKGSNILFDDKGFSGMVIYNNISFLTISKRDIHVGSGYSFPSLGVKLARMNLSGLEFAAGVPGTLGGAIYMNASAFGQSISDTIESVVILNEEGEIETLKKNDLEFNYRTSCFQRSKSIILSGKFSLENNDNARDKQIEFLTKKRKNQPLNEKNAGCIFKNPESMSAKKIIAECGLKNHQIGGAKISDLHANFIINENDASSKDVIDLISHIKRVVKEKTNIELFEEVKFIPY
ncbi:MAG: hypothetical protein K1000chlam1_01402, partial [Candidatus Anoxychlamydiales bacterium]|nr:hypothetical protein [Candidatus Anoxychlamydiales bacterium]